MKRFPLIQSILDYCNDMMTTLNGKDSQINVIYVPTRWYDILRKEMAEAGEQDLNKLFGIPIMYYGDSINVGMGNRIGADGELR